MTKCFLNEIHRPSESLMNMKTTATSGPRSLLTCTSSAETNKCWKAKKNAVENLAVVHTPRISDDCAVGSHMYRMKLMKMVIKSRYIMGWIYCIPVHPITKISRLASPTISGTRERCCQPLFEPLSPLQQKRPVQCMSMARKNTNGEILIVVPLKRLNEEY